MSMGPSPKKEVIFKPNLSTRISNSIKKSTEEYFRDPLYYLFHIVLFGTAISIILHQELNWKIYIFLFILAFFAFDKEKEKPKKSKK